MKLRPYQQRAVDSIYEYFRAGNTGNPLVLLPTASGKSVVQADFCRSALAAYPNTRIICATHVKELIEQNYDKMRSIWPEAPAGIYSASVNRREARAQILFAGIQTVYNKTHEIGWCDLLFVDEAHLIPHAGNGQYRKFIRALRAYNPKLKVIGVTATGYRQGQGTLIDGDDALFTDIILDLTQGEELVELIDDGYLSPLRPKATTTEIDLSKVKTTAGEFNSKQLQAAVNTCEITSAAIDESLLAGHDRKSRLWFCAGVEHAMAVRDELRARGHYAECVTGETPKKDRERILADFKSGKLRDLTNANVLTTGFDHPGLDMIILLRPTKSASLHVQMLGRGMRVVYSLWCDLSTKEGRLEAIATGPKQDCLVLDFAGNTARLGPINAIRPPKAKGKKQEGAQGPPTKTCIKCAEIVAISMRVCPGCGHEFPPPEKELYRHASTEQMIVRAADLVAWHDVDNVRYALHHPPHKSPSLKVTYECGFETFHEWVGIGYSTGGGTWAAKWWAKRSERTPPLSVPHALERTAELSVPARIKVSVAKKYPEIVRFDFTGSE